MRARCGPTSAGAVEFTGAVADPRPELARAVCLLHCADAEPFGMVVLESLAAGRPVVVPASAGPAEIVEPACGFLYPPGDAVGRRGRDPASAREPRASGGDGCPRAGAREGELRRRRGAPALRRRLAGCSRALGGTAGQTQPPPELAIVTVTHNSEPELRTLLGSVDRHLPGTSVVVVDSGSSDGSVDVARGWAGTGDRDRAGRERRLRARVQPGLSELAAPVVALLNPDVELIDDSLRELAAEVARSDRPTRLLAPRGAAPGRNPAGLGAPPADLGAGPDPRARAPRRAAQAPWRCRWHRGRPTSRGTSGGRSAAPSSRRTETLRRLGPFDERIFLYAEDLDLGLRAADVGVETWFWPSARVLHARAHASVRALRR